MEPVDLLEFNHDRRSWIEASLASTIVHMVLIVGLGLMFNPVLKFEPVEIVITNLSEQDIELLPTPLPAADAVEVDTSALTASLTSSQLNSNDDPFSRAGAASFAIAAPAVEATFRASETQNIAGKLDQGIGAGIAEQLGGKFGDRLTMAGAKTGAIQFSLVWDNYNDFDLHVVTPSGERISYLRPRSRCGGHLDVDMNAGGKMSNEPVENVYWDVKKAPRGTFKVYVVYYARRDRETDGGKFNLAVKIDKKIETYSGELSQSNREVLVGSFLRK